MMKIFCGEDNYESILKAKKYSRELLEQHPHYDFKIIHATDITDVGNLFSSLTEVNLFGSSQVLLIKDFIENNLLVDYLVKNWITLIKLPIVFHYSKTLDKRSQIYKLAIAEGVLMEFELLKNSDITKWLNKITKLLNMHSLDIQIQEFLIKTWGNNKWGLYTELIKIKAFDTKYITTDLLTYLDPEQEIWSLIEFFCKKDLKSFVINFIDKTENTDIAQLFITVLHRNLKNIGLVKHIYQTNKDFSILNLHPFVLKKNIEYSKNFTIEEIRQILFKLILIDNDIKNGEGHFRNQVLVLALTYLQ